MTVDVVTGDTALARCVARSAEEFGAEHWGRSPLLSRASELPSGFADLFDPAAVDELVSERGLRTPFLRMAKDGSVRPAGTYTRGGGAGAAIADQVADDKVLAALADGSTLVLQGLHRTWPPLVEFATRLADELGHPAQINAYITPPQNQGFAPHHDVHDVFVLQIAGRKRWTVHPPVVTDPLSNQPFDAYKAQIADRVPEEPAIDTVLEPGDALYLPRGTVHSAVAQGDVSIHLTIGVHPLTRYDLVRQLLDAVQDDPRLRASLPVGQDLDDPEVLEPHLEATVEALTEALSEVPADRVARRIGSNLMGRTRPEPIAPLAQLAAADGLESQTRLRRRAALRHRITLDEARDRVRLEFMDRSLEFPAATAEAVAFILDRDEFSPGELPGLDEADGLTLARRLLREGVVVSA
ncbi:cupin [Thermoleophilia bacterium SCSIO 60948]|nr:cupin [Thermoleophilia bacterium SCSIO 60948]